MIIVLKSVGVCSCNSNKFKHKCFYETRRTFLFPLQKIQKWRCFLTTLSLIIYMLSLTRIVNKHVRNFSHLDAILQKLTTIEFSWSRNAFILYKNARCQLGLQTTTSTWNVKILKQEKKFERLKFYAFWNSFYVTFTSLQFSNKLSQPLP